MYIKLLQVVYFKYQCSKLWQIQNCHNRKKEYVQRYTDSSYNKPKYMYNFESYTPKLRSILAQLYNRKILNKNYCAAA